ncbi:MAG: MFS transporter [Bacteroidales bacterium]|nr:MFS transporter [Bacteroidales bacterium]
MIASKKEKNVTQLLPIMIAFFTMGFVDMVGTVANYVKADFNLSDTMANFLPSMVFFWFLILSLPTSMLMSRIGKRKTVILSLLLTVLALVVPLLSYSYPAMLLSFSLLGIGNTLMQVSLNPLVSLVVRRERLASSLTFGQFVKAIASFITPLLASWAAVQFDNWKMIYPIFMVISAIAMIFLWSTTIKEEVNHSSSIGFLQCLKLLGNTTLFLFFLGIVCHVGIDVGINLSVPKIIMERTGIPLEKAAIATSVYFFFRTIGCLTGSIILAKWHLKKFFALSTCLMSLSFIGLFIAKNLTFLYICIAIVGYGNSNIFSMIFSNAILSLPEKTNEISGLMIMGLIGGSIFPLFMGLLSDAIQSQSGSVIIMSIGVFYLLFLAFRIYKVSK